MRASIEHLIDSMHGKAPLGVERSPLWRKVRAEHLLEFPECAICGGNKKIQVHHIIPYHLAPTLELEPSNLITLCVAGKGGLNCHLFFGHLGNFRLYNPSVALDAFLWHHKIKEAKGADSFEPTP